jgi:hypothetical protein
MSPKSPGLDDTIEKNRMIEWRMERMNRGFVRQCMKEKDEKMNRGWKIYVVQNEGRTQDAGGVEDK